MKVWSEGVTCLGLSKRVRALSKVACQPLRSVPLCAMAAEALDNLVDTVVTDTGVKQYEALSARNCAVGATFGDCVLNVSERFI